MALVLLHHKGAYQLYSTVADGPCFVTALTLPQLRAYIKREQGNDGLRELPERLERAHATGTSMRGTTLRGMLTYNRAGPRETKMSYEDFIAKYLTLPT